MGKKIPMSVERLVAVAVDDGSDYDDYSDGYTGHTFDQPTGVLTLWFRRWGAGELGAVAEYDPDQDLYGSASYRFKLVTDD